MPRASVRPRRARPRAAARPVLRLPALPWQRIGLATVVRGLEGTRPAFGRMQRIDIRGRQVRLLLVDDHTEPPLGDVAAPFEFVDRGVGRAGGRVGACDVSGPFLVGSFALHGHALRDPVLLSSCVRVDRAEPEGFEPHRGSWAQVSLMVVAVDDDRPACVEL